MHISPVGWLWATFWWFLAIFRKIQYFRLTLSLPKSHYCDFVTLGGPPKLVEGLLDWFFKIESQICSHFLLVAVPSLNSIYSTMEPLCGSPPDFKALVSGELFPNPKTAIFKMGARFWILAVNWLMLHGFLWFWCHSTGNCILQWSKYHLG